MMDEFDVARVQNILWANRDAETQTVTYGQIRRLVVPALAVPESLVLTALFHQRADDARVAMYYVLDKLRHMIAAHGYPERILDPINRQEYARISELYQDGEWRA